MRIPSAAEMSALCYFTEISYSETDPLQPQDHEQFADIISAPESAGFCSWLHSFINRLLGIFGEKLSPDQLNQSLDSIFSEDKEWQQNRDVNAWGVKQTVLRVKESAGIAYIVCATTHDLPESDSVAAHMAGGRSLLQIFTALADACQQGSAKALIPVAQSNTYGPFGPRGHFTLLEADIDNGIIQSAVLHDPKGGFVDMFYGGAGRLTAILRKENLIGDDFSVTVEHRGDQSLLNGNDCGRFAAYYAAKITAEGGLDCADKKGAVAFFAEHF
ncbi:hypothetical protein [Morganella morganii]|uniref:hypothetical protein n=1 Tax=Morganella morganii TaxID=582 RepID=UPI0021D39B8F|nr:hypothetical protein [Morganella morganii]MCU6224655.1 hypothetical protein [Morganella morganii]MCU6233402.1 hypothetical protein [Morganella morganii]